ncbi:unnamed protein product, partial [Aphanomyces euteiches]
MPGTVTDCILGVDYLSRVRAVIDLANDVLRIPGVLDPLPLIREPTSESSSPPSDRIAAVFSSPPKPDSSMIAVKEDTTLLALSRQI